MPTIFIYHLEKLCMTEMMNYDPVSSSVMVEGCVSCYFSKVSSSGVILTLILKTRQRLHRLYRVRIDCLCFSPVLKVIIKFDRIFWLLSFVDIIWTLIIYKHSEDLIKEQVWNMAGSALLDYAPSEVIVTWTLTLTLNPQEVWYRNIVNINQIYQADMYD